MREFIKYTVKFPLTNGLHCVELLVCLGGSIKGDQGSGMLSAKTQEHISGGDNVDY